MSGESSGTGKPEGSEGIREDEDGPPDEGSRKEGRDAGEGEGGEPESEDEEARRPISVRDLMPSPPSRPSRRPAERSERPERAAEPEKEAAEPMEGEGAPAGEEGTEEPSEESPGEAIEESGGPEPSDAEVGGPGGAASVPTPVRVAMDAPPPGDSRPPEELPSRRFEVEGQEWIVRISGRTITGTRPDSGALLMHLSFFRAEAPEDAHRRLVTVDRPLDALYDEDLMELYERSRPAGGGGSGSE